MINQRTGGSLWYGLAAVIASASMFLAPVASMAQDAKDRTALKVCADGNNMPYSNSDKEGFENKIAELFGDYLGLPVEYTFFPQRLGFIRNTLKAETGVDSYKCDIVMGVPSGFDIASPTNPYYRTTYVLTYVKGRGYDSVKEPEDVAELSAKVKDDILFGVFDQGPAQLWVFENDFMDQMRPYRAMPGSTEITPGDVMEDLINDEIDMTIIYGPFAGWWKKKTDKVDIVTIPMMNDPDNAQRRFEFNMSMAVRYGEDEWKQTVNKFIREKKDEIHAILEEYNVPLLSLDQKI